MKAPVRWAVQVMKLKPPPLLTDAQWRLLAPLIAEGDPPISERNPGRRRVDPRGALDAIIYHEVTGCAWNRLPDHFPDDSSVHRTYMRWVRSGLLARLLQTIIQADSARRVG